MIPAKNFAICFSCIKLSSLFIRGTLLHRLFSILSESSSLILSEENTCKNESIHSSSTSLPRTFSRKYCILFQYGKYLLETALECLSELIELQQARSNISHICIILENKGISFHFLPNIPLPSAFSW